MTPALVNTITEQEAEQVRSIVASVGDVGGSAPFPNPADADGHGRIWSPIAQTVSTSGRAHCRLCSGAIAKDERCIQFGFDPYGEGKWGKLSAAYLHLTCPAKGAR